MEQDDLFALVSRGLLWQLSAIDDVRGAGALHRRHALNAAESHLFVTVVRMLALATAQRFPTFQQLALLLVCHSVDCCELFSFPRTIVHSTYHRMRNRAFVSTNTAKTYLLITIVRMIAHATAQHFPTFQKLALLLACHSVDCFELFSFLRTAVHSSTE